MLDHVQRMLQSPMVKRLLAFAAAIARLVGQGALRVARAVLPIRLARTWRAEARLQAVAARGFAQSNRAAEANASAARHERLFGSRPLHALSTADTDRVAA